MVYVDATLYPPAGQTEIKINIARKLVTRSPAATTSALAFAFFSSIPLSFHVPIRDLIIWAPSSTPIRRVIGLVWSALVIVFDARRCLPYVF